jgi:hypothetical protein
MDDALNPGTGPSPRRLFLHEGGWRIVLKVGSDREFCYMAAPGQDFYHRLLDGEIYLTRADEKLCLACAERRGILAYEPRSLREPASPPDLGPPSPSPELPA